MEQESIFIQWEHKTTRLKIEWSWWNKSRINTWTNQSKTQQWVLLFFLRLRTAWHSFLFKHAKTSTLPAGRQVQQSPFGYAQDKNNQTIKQSNNLPAGRQVQNLNLNFNLKTWPLSAKGWSPFGWKTWPLSHPLQKRPPQESNKPNLPKGQAIINTCLPNFYVSPNLYLKY